MSEKRCNTCKLLFPLTSEYFHKDARSKDGFTFSCKTCAKARAKKHYHKDPEKRREYNREYRRTHPEETRAIVKEWRLKNPGRNRALTQNWLKKNRARNFATQQRYNRKHRDKIYALSHNRRARVRSLPGTYTPHDWLDALAYFKGYCAVCGRQLNDLFGERTAARDHWIPVNHPDCPGTVATNIVPLCHGLHGCNNSKKNKLPDIWLKAQFGAKRAAQIQSRINTFFEWIAKPRSDRNPPLPRGS